MSRAPRVTVGLPVRNGENYLAEAIDSILAQTFADFELVISDNGSTDATASICERYAALDDRVRYHRSDENRGATWNFNRVARLADGELFRWAAHDDRLAPTCLERCVATMDADPEVVLVHSEVEIIDGDGRSHGTYDDTVIDSAAPTPAERFRQLLRGHRCFEIFGLVRSDALRRVPEMGAYGHADGVLLARLGLLGPFSKIPDPLFAQRMHAEQSMNVYGAHSGVSAAEDGPPDYHAYAEWFDPTRPWVWVFPYWRILREHLASALRVGDLGPADRVRCLVHVAGWIRHERHWLATDLRVAAVTALRRVRRTARPADLA